MVERKTFNLVAVGSIPTEGVFCVGAASGPEFDSRSAAPGDIVAEWLRRQT